jgi:hypothetical protein
VERVEVVAAGGLDEAADAGGRLQREHDAVLVREVGEQRRTTRATSRATLVGV